MDQLPSERPVPLGPRDPALVLRLLVPLAVALASGTPTRASWLLTAAAFATTWAVEPFMVLSGYRGARARMNDGSRALARLGWLAGLAVATTALGLHWAPRSLVLAAAAPVPPACVLLWLLERRRERSALGEVMTALTLAGAALPVAIASGVRGVPALGMWAAWVLGFSTAILAGRSMFVPTTRGQTTLPASLAVAPAVAAAVLLWQTLGLVELIAATPLFVAASLVYVIKPSAQRVRQVTLGFGLAAIAAGAIHIFIAKAVRASANVSETSPRGR